MSLLNPAILYGLLLAGLPVILHLLLKQKPKKLLFPALRLIQQRRKQNLKRIRLRHIWLLLLRILAIALIVVAIARPSLPAADYSFNLREWLTVAFVVAAAVGAYFFLLTRWRSRQMPRHEFNYRRAAARGWATGAALLALLLLVGWPYQRRIAAEIKAPPPSAQLDLPVAAVFLFDTSLSMLYQQEGKTRLDVARAIALDHLSELPSGSKVAVVDSGSDIPILFQPTLSAAQTRLKGLETNPVSLPLNDRVRSALLAQEDDRDRTLSEQGAVPEEIRKDRYLRRVYVFTDLAQTAWRLGGSSLLKKEIERLETVGVFLVDVGDPQPLNYAVRQVRLSRQQIPVGGRLEVSALVDAIGRSGDLDVELVRTGGDASSRLDLQTRPVESESSQWINFRLLSELTGPVLHGEVRLVSSDPLQMDDVRSFSVQVGEPPRVLVIAPGQNRLGDPAFYWFTALAPDNVKFGREFLPVARIGDADYSRYDVVYLINVPQLPDDEWSRLAQFVEEGGGLGVFLGDEQIQPHAYNRGQAQSLLPARVDVHRYREDRRLSVERREHPVFRKLDDDGAVPIIENDVFVDRFFVLEPAPNTGVIARFTDEDGSPALVERVHGRGRAVMFASAVDLAAGGRSRWNNLADPTEVGWPFLALAESLTLYLARSTENVFNVTAGEEVVLSMEPSNAVRTFLLRRPEFRQTREQLPAGESELIIRDAHDIGRYELVDAAQTTQPLLGFSVNPPPGESDLARLTDKQLADLLGEDRYQVARTIDELDASVNIANLGREVFPIILLLVVVAFLGEHLVANRFYEIDEDAVAEQAAPRKIAAA